MNAMVGGFEPEPFGRMMVNGREIRFADQGAGWRYRTLLEKEPETIEWIDGFQDGETLWDIGANVGIYSVYAALRGIATTAFEPHFANYHHLCMNIGLNRLQTDITPLCLAVAEHRAIASMNLAQVAYGTSMSSFGSALDFRGQPFQPEFRQGMIGCSIDDLIADFGMVVPSHIKIDVDGIEAAIVRGARRTLADPALRSVSIELIDSDADQVGEVTRLMIEAGLSFRHKRQNAAFATSETRDVLNFLFCRDEPIACFGRSRSPIEVDTVVARLVERIEAAAVDPVPSANIYLETALPPSVYAELLERLPCDDVLDPIDHPDAVAADGSITRRLIDLTSASIARFAPADRPFWTALADAMTSPALARAIVDTFGETLRARFGDVLPELVAVPILYRDYPGYRIGIHPDTPAKIATLQFYLPADDSQRHLGTSFHTQGESGYGLHKTNVFAPNSAYAFVRTDGSFHSVAKLAADEAPRNTLALTFYVKGEEYRSEPKPTTAAAPAPAPAPKSSDDMALDHALATLASSFTRRCDVATLIREDGVGVELGVAAGDFSARILERSRIGYLYSVDMWAGDRGHDVAQYRAAITRLHPHRARNALLRMRFDEALALFGDHSLDFIYIDGYAHTGEENGRTFADWYPKLRSGGIIAGDDYHADWPLVVAAVDDFIARAGLSLHVIDCREESWNSMYPTWFAMKP